MESKLCLSASRGKGLMYLVIGMGTIFIVDKVEDMR